MTFQLFTATGCIRCRVVKQYMTENRIDFEEYDIKAEGKDAFKLFYKENRAHVRRGPEGIEFPILFTGGRVYQGLGVAMAYLMAKDGLEGIVAPSDLCHGWVGGFQLFCRPLTDEEVLAKLLRYLKKAGLKIELETDGHHFECLGRFLQDQLIDRLQFVLRGPAALYQPITGSSLSEAALSQSLALLKPPLDYKIVLPVGLVRHDDGSKPLLTVEEAENAARFVEKSTGIKTHPFFIRSEVPEPSALFKYRTRCRRFMVRCEIEQKG